MLQTVPTNGIEIQPQPTSLLLCGRLPHSRMTRRTTLRDEAIPESDPYSTSKLSSASEGLGSALMVRTQVSSSKVMVRSSPFYSIKMLLGQFARVVGRSGIVISSSQEA
jgi:hypothetical protein